MSARQTLSQVLASINVHKANHDIFMAVYDAMYPERTVNDLSEAVKDEAPFVPGGCAPGEPLITCKVSRFPHVKTWNCEESKPHTEFQVPYSEGGNYRIPDHVGDTVRILPSKPMQKDEPAVGGCVIPVIKSITPATGPASAWLRLPVPSVTPRNVIAEMRESGVDHFVDEPDENGGRN